MYRAARSFRTVTSCIKL